jgi:glutathione S-transferase
LKLYALPQSPNTMKVVALIHYLELPVEIISVDMQSGFNRGAEYLALNPNGLMPTLVEGDFSLWESNAILVYLASKGAGQTLLPSEPKANADVLRWIFWNSSHFGPAIRPWVYERLFKPRMQQTPDEGKVTEAEPQFHVVSKILESQLSRQSFVVGETLTLADFALTASLVYAHPAGMPLEGYPKIKAWLATVLALPAWQKAIPQMTH